MGTRSSVGPVLSSSRVRTASGRVSVTSGVRRVCLEWHCPGCCVALDAVLGRIPGLEFNAQQVKGCSCFHVEEERQWGLLETQGSIRVKTKPKLGQKDTARRGELDPDTPRVSYFHVVL